MINEVEHQNETLKAIIAFDRLQCVQYMTDQLLKLGFIEIANGVFIYGENFKVVFSVGDNYESVTPMQVIHKPIDGCERKYAEYLELYSIAHIRAAYTKLTGEPL